MKEIGAGKKREPAQVRPCQHAGWCQADERVKGVVGVGLRLQCDGIRNVNGADNGNAAQAA